MFMNFLADVCLGRRNYQLDFAGNLHYDLDPGTLFHLCLFKIRDHEGIRGNAAVPIVKKLMERVGTAFPLL